jgi:hypothetical protein
MTYNYNDIINFIKGFTHFEDIPADMDIYCLLNKNYDTFITDYAENFNVEMKMYMRNFHVNETLWIELFLFPFHFEEERIIITPALLTEFATKGKWDLVYPPVKIHV